MYKEQLSQRYIGLDFLKLICSFLVIHIHMSSVGKQFLLPISRVAVPLFFMISGFFYTKLSCKRKIYQLKKLAFLFIFSHVFYAVYDLLQLAFSGETILPYFSKFFALDFWVIFLVFNEALISVQLWYLSAVFYVLIIVFVAEKRFSLNSLYKFIPVLLLLNFLLGTYANPLFGLDIPIVISRNFLFCGLPFFLMGSYMRAHQPTFSNRFLLAAISITLVASLSENILLINNFRKFNNDLYITTPFLALFLFLLVINNEPCFAMKPLKAASELGRKTSTYIFVIHPIVIYALLDFVERLALTCPVITRAYAFYSVPLVFVVCLICSLLIIKLKSVLQKSWHTFL